MCRERKYFEMNLNNMKIGIRLGLAFGVVLLITIISALLTLSKVADVQNNLRDIVQDNNVKLKLTNDMADTIHVIARVGSMKKSRSARPVPTTTVIWPCWRNFP